MGISRHLYAVAIGLAVGVGVLGLAGCYQSFGPPIPDSSVPAPGAYYCIAANAAPGGSTATALSQDQHTAPARAMQRCRAKNQYPHLCHIRFCGWVSHRERPTSQWYTCYVASKKRDGVWSGTSHRVFNAKSLALTRCRRVVGQGGAPCYLRYCRSW